MDMPWTEARTFAECVADDRRQRWVETATACRAARFEDKSWQKIMRDVG